VSGPGLAGRWRSIFLPLAFLRLTGQAAEFIGWVIFARRLGTSAFGDLSIAFLVARYLGLIADWGASFRGARDVAANGRYGSVAGYVRKRTRTAIALSLGAAAIPLLLGRPSLAPMAVVVLSLGLSRDWISIGLERGARGGIPIAVQGLLILGLSAVTNQLLGAAVAVAVGYGAAAVLSVALNPLVLVEAPEIEETAHGWVLAAVLANQVTSSTDTVLLGILVSTSSAGIYAAIYRLPNAWLAVLTLLLGSLLPIATRSHHADDGSHLELRRYSLRVSAIGAVGILVLAPVSYLLVPVLFGDAYRAGQWPLVVLMVATAVITFAAPLHPFALSSGRDRPYALVLVVGASANFLANLVVIPVMGMMGAACTTLAAQVIVSVALWRLVRRASPPAVEVGA
jgi:O-antigen/teichoic acid export membrane protein